VAGVTVRPRATLESYRQAADLSGGELWLRYFALGGMGTAFQLEAFLHGALTPTPHDHDVIAHALNERFVELGGNHPVPYDDDEPHAQSEATGHRRRPRLPPESTLG
jgi:hypothetical protein